MYKLAQFRKRLKEKSTIKIADSSTVNIFKVELTKEQEEESKRYVVISVMIAKLRMIGVIRGYQDIKDTIKTRKDASIYRKLYY